MTDQLKILSPEAYEFYRSSGYTIIDQEFLSHVEFSEFRELAYQQLKRPDGEVRSACLPMIQDRDSRLQKWILHPAFINLAKDMLGPDVAFCTSTIYFKVAQSSELLTWHRDYHMVPKAPASARHKVINIVFALDDAPVESGCLQYVPGSHLEEVRFSPDPVPNTMIYTGVIKAELHTEKPVFAPLKANQVAAHNALIVHGSGPNTSAANRCLVSIRFFSTAEDKLLSLYLLNCKGAQLVSGKDRSGKELPVSPYYLP